MNLQPVREWFGYTRRERRASFLLLILIFVVIAIRLFLPESTTDIREITSEFNFTTIQEVRKLSRLGDEKRIQFSDNSLIGNTPKDKIRGTLYADNYSYSGSVNRKSVSQKLVELNSCDSASLEKLPGIGPVLSVRIIKFRNLLGGFSDVTQLKDVYGLSSETYDLIRSRVAVDTAMLNKIDINSSDYRTLNRHPYIENFEAQAILKYRDLNGSISGLQELVDNRILTEEKAHKLLPYLKF